MNTRKYLLLIAFLCLSLLPAYAAAQRDIVEFKAQLSQLVETSDHLSMRVLGTAVHGDQSFPIWLVKFKGAAKKKLKVFISGGLHGDEPAGPQAVLATIAAVANDPDKYRRVNIDFIPLVNPSGWINGTRETASGHDINRDYYLRNTQETMIVDSFLQQRGRYRLMVDHHEDPRYPGFYAVTYGNGNETVIKHAVSVLEQSGYELRPFSKTVGWFGVSKQKTPRLKNKTFMSYAREHYSKRVYQVESPTSVDMAQRTAAHALFDDLVLKKEIEE